jgi:hypothetical protein
MKNVSDKICRVNQNTFICSITFIQKSCRLWYNVEKYCRAGQATGDNMKYDFTYQITKTTDTHSEYAILIAFPQQQ